MSQSRPTLSFCLAGRNDNYFGDYKYRVSSCINLLCKGLERLGRLDAVEVLVSDWGSERPLAKDIQLSRAAQQIVRFLYTPPEIARKLHNDSFFPTGFVSNGAFRRARGEFVSYWDSDTLLSQSSIRCLLDALEGRISGIPYKDIYWFANRRHLPIGIVNRQPSILEIEEYLNRNQAYLIGESLGPGMGSGSAQILHRDIMAECRGFDERMRWWGWTDVDLAIRLNQRYPALELNNFGVLAIHQEHYTSRVADSDKELKQRQFNQADCLPKFQLNDENWGYANEPLVFMPGEAFEDENARDRTDRVGETEAWSMTQAQLLQELQALRYREALKPVLDVVRAPEHEWNALQVLAWYAQTKGVITYAELGFRFPQAACVVVRNSPGAEVHGISAFFNRTPGPETLEPITNCNYFENCVFQNVVALRHLSMPFAYLRWTGGDPTQAIANLSKSAAGRFAYDLALIRCGPTIPYGPEQAIELSRFLRPGGMIVVLGEDPAAFQQTISALAQAHPQFMAGAFQDGITGFLLAATLAG